MSTNECFERTKVRVMDLSSDGHLMCQPERSWASTLEGISLTRPPNVSKRLFIVQAINNEIRTQLHQSLGVEEEFFSNHLDNRWWYLSAVQPGRSEPKTPIPELPSQTSKLNFIKLRFIQAGESPFRGLQGRVGIVHADTGELCVRSCLGRAPDHVNQRTALVVQQFSPISLHDQKTDQNLPVMLAHTSVSAWFKMEKDGQWTGIILFDPSIMPKNKDGSISKNVKERIPALCKKYFSSLSESQFASHPFLVLSNLYGLIAEEWVGLSKYLKRELETIEYNLENAHHNVAQCEEYLVHLASYRRRICCYIDLSRQQLTAIESFGCKAWPVKRPSTEMEQARAELLEDFVYVVKLLEKHSQRLNRNLELLLGLRGVYLSRNMASLALVGVIFLPFSCVASVLGMPGKYGPGAEKFWVYWAISAPVIAVVLLVHLTYGSERQPRVRPAYGVSGRVNIDRYASQMKAMMGGVWPGAIRRARPYGQSNVDV